MTTKKRKGKHYYYYAVECQRVNGKPRIVWQVYLGKLEDIVRKVTGNGAPKPYQARVFEFGTIAALYDIARRLQLVETVDQHARKREQGVSVGHYMLIAALNRCIDPKSKRAIGDWFEKTILRRLLPVKKDQLSSQRFWDNMQHLDQAKIEQIEATLNRQLVEVFNLNLEAVVYDTTNSFTYIDSGTDCELPQRGKSKEGRKDLRIVGLAMMVTMDFRIPLFHEVYPGNKHDSREFISVVDRLVQRYKLLAHTCEHIALVYDKGNNSKEGQPLIQDSPYYFGGSLVPSQHTDLLAIPTSEFKPLQGAFAGEKAYRTKKTVCGRECLIVITYNETLYLGQLQGLIVTSKKATKKLKELSKQLEKRRLGEVIKGRAPTVESVTKQVQQILSGQYLKDIIGYTVKERNGLPDRDFTVDTDALHQLADERFGKTILFTDHFDWTNEQVVAGYRGQYPIEDGFKAMKDPQVVSWQPMYHWTDHNIRVHAFYCVLALMLASLLRRELHQHGIEMSIPKMLDTLEGIEEVAHIYPPNSKVANHFTLTEMNEEQKRLYDVLGLEQYALRSG